MAWDEACVNFAPPEVGNVQNEFVVGNCGWHASNDCLIQSTLHTLNGLGPVFTPHHQLAKQGVIVGWHLQSSRRGYQGRMTYMISCTAAERCIDQPLSLMTVDLLKHVRAENS